MQPLPDKESDSRLQLIDGWIDASVSIKRNKHTRTFFGYLDRLGREWVKEGRM